MLNVSFIKELSKGLLSVFFIVLLASLLQDFLRVKDCFQKLDLRTTSLYLVINDSTLNLETRVNFHLVDSEFLTLRLDYKCS
jgi:hypothetical protein